MASQQEIIQSFMRSLDNSDLSGISAVNQAVQTCSNNQFSTLQEVIDKMVNDCNNAGSSDNFLRNYCGIILDNEDTGAITGSDAGGPSAKTNESIVPENGSFQNFTGNSFSTNGLNFKLSYVSDENYSQHAYDRDYSSLSYTEGLIWQALYSWWGKESLDLISSSYGNNFGFNSYSSATAHDMHVGFYNKNNGVLAYVTNWSSNGIGIDMDLMINMYYYDNVNTSDPNGSTSTTGASYLDRTLAHEMTHAVMGANIKNFADLPLIIKEGMAELTHGIDDIRYYTIRYLAGNSSALNSALNLNISGGTSDNYAGGFMLLRYLAKQLSDSNINPGFTQWADYYENTTSNVTLNALGGNDTVENNGASNVKIYGGKNNDSLISDKSCNKVTISGDSGNDYIRYYQNVKNSKMIGGTGKDSIYGSGVKVTVTGNSGDDYVRLYSDTSKNKVYGGAGKDTINGGGTKSTLSGGSGKDKFILYSSDASVRANGDSGNDYFKIYDKSASPTVSGGSDNDSVYSGATKAYLLGGSGKDYFKLSSSSQNSTVNGGTGNDTIKNYSSSKTTYIYKNGDGKDVISGFNFGKDRIKITSGSVSKKSYSGNDVILKVGDGSIRIKNGKGKKITVVNSKGKTKNYIVGTASSNISANISNLWFDDSNSSTNSEIFGQSLDNLPMSSEKSSTTFGENKTVFTDPSTVTATKYVFYADENKTLA